MNHKKSKHDQYVEKLVKQIELNYDYIYTHKKFSRNNRLIAEIDILATAGNEISVFEVKCSYRITKAKKQFKKIRKLFPNENFMCYFYCGISDKLVEVEVC